MDYSFKPTTHGRAVLAACMSLGERPDICRVAFGSGRISETANLADQHELLEFVADGTIGSRRHKDDHFCFTIQYLNSAHPDVGTFYLSEFIVYIRDPETGEETDLLYGTLGDYRLPVPQYHDAIPPSVFDLPLVLVISDEVTVQISAPPGLVTYDGLQEMISEALGEAGGSISAAIKAHNEDPEAHAEIIEGAVDSAFQRLVTDGTVIDRTEVVRLITAATNGTGGVFSGALTLTLPADGWVLSETPKGSFLYSCDVAAEGVTTAHWPIGGVSLESEAAAQKAGVGGGCDTLDGCIRFYAKAIPDEDIQANLVLFIRDEGTGGTGAIPVASSTTLGGVKIPANSGLIIDSEGNLIVDTPTDEEASDAIESAFDGNA